MLKKLFISTIALANNLVATDFNFSINSEISNNHTQEIITPAENFDLYEQVEKEFVTFCKFNGKIIRKNNIGILTKDHYGKNYENYRNELISAAYINRNKKLHVTIKNKTIFFENPPNLLDIESSYSCNISYNFQDSYLNSGLFYDIFCVMLKANYLALQTKEVIELSEKDITDNEIYVVQKQTIKDILEEEDFNAKCISYIHAFYQKQPNQNQFIDKYETISNLLPKLAYITDDSNALDGWINYLPSSYISLYQYVGESRPLYQGLNETCPEHTFNPFIFYSIIFGDFSKAIAELTGVTPVWDSINQRYSDYFAVKEGSYSIIKRDGYLITKKSILYPYALRATELLILRLRTLFRLPAFDDKFFMAHIPSINDNVRIIYNNQSKGMLITEKICELEGSTIKNQYEKVKSWCNEIINLQSFNQRIFRECSNHMISYIPMLLDFCKVNISPQEFFDSNIMPDDYKEIDIPLNRFDKFFARYYKKINEIFNTFHQDNIEKNPNKMLVHAFSDITSIANNSISGHRIDTVYYLCAKYRFLNSNSSRQQTWIQAESVFNTLGNITDQIVFACQVRDAIFPTISLKNFLHNYVVDMNNENCSHVRTDEEVAQMIFTTHLSSSRKNLSNFSDKSSETSSISSSSSTSYKIIPFIEEAFNDIQNDSRLLKDILPPPQILYEKVPQ